METGYFWLSFDLGLKGDYQGLYAWLDTHEASECGDNLAYIGKYQYSENLAIEVKRDLQSQVNFKNTDRVYLIREESGNLRGMFIIGNRRKEYPWKGYGTVTTTTTEDGPGL